MKMRIFLVLTFTSSHLMPFHTLTVGEGWEIFERRKSGVSFRKLQFGKKCEAERTEEVERQDELFCKTAYFIEREKTCSLKGKIEISLE